MLLLVTADASSDWKKCGTYQEQALDAERPAPDQGRGGAEVPVDLRGAVLEVDERGLAFESEPEEGSDQPVGTRRFNARQQCDRQDRQHPARA